jgi:hydroxyacylglutathione hydrolase
VEVPLAGPRRQQQQDARPGLAAYRVPFARIKRHECPRTALDALPGRLDLRAPLDDSDPRALAYLMLAQLLSGRDHEHHGTRAVFGREDDGVTRALGRVDPSQIPALHQARLYQPASRLKRRMPPVVDRYVLGPVETNCYVVRADRGAREAVVIDPGDDAAALQHELERMGASCAAILVTHGHFDHVGAVADLAEATGAPVYMPAGDAEWLVRYHDFAPPGLGAGRPYTPDVLLEGDEKLELAGLTFETIPIPGHTAAHVAFHTDGSLFSGDLLFAGGVGRVDLPGGDWDTLLDSIRALADRFPPETVVYSGHGRETTLGVELARNPFLAELRAS